MFICSFIYTLPTVVETYIFNILLLEFLLWHSRIPWRLGSSGVQVQASAQQTGLGNLALPQLWLESRLQMRSDPWLGAPSAPGWLKKKFFFFLLLTVGSLLFSTLVLASFLIDCS